MDSTNNELPVKLAKMRYKCGVHSFDVAKYIEILKHVVPVGMTRVSAQRYNKYNKSLYPKAMEFFVGRDEDIIETIDRVIQDNHISGVWACSYECLNWNEFYNIQIVDPNDDLYGKVFKAVVGEKLD